jgi:hypothetical protein
MSTRAGKRFLAREMESQLMSTASRAVCVAIAMSVALFAVGAQAGPLPLDPNGMGGVNQGSAIFPTNTVAGTFSISAEVDFAVYAPGKFNLSYPGQDPSGGTRWVYAYEVTNTGQVPGPSPISSFSVAILPVSGGPPAAGAANIENLPLVAGQAPGAQSFSSTSAVWDYSGANLGVGANSDILLFTAPHPPTMQSASVVGGGLGTSHNLPSPIPEPSTYVLLAIGGAALLTWRRRSSGT